MSEKVTCHFCEEEFEHDKIHEFDGQFLCSECLQDETFGCSRCGDRHWNDDNEGDDDTQICSRCFDYYYTRCEDCNRLISIDDAYYLDDDDNVPYCCKLEKRIINGVTFQYIKHSQEQPEYTLEHTVLLDEPVDEKIYVIDDVDHVTMLLAEEY